MILPFVIKIFPLVSKELEQWKAMAAQIPDENLRIQALASIRDKKFHVQGGSVYALDPRVSPEGTVRFIVALQTISDYLDNLCDRAGVMDESAFFQLHLAMADAVEPTRPVSDYYHDYPFTDDGGYLASLVTACREQIRGLPSYSLVLPVMKRYVERYSELQSYKHLNLNRREAILQDWAQRNLDPALSIFWWEYAAATGSTLGMFLLFVAASDTVLTQTTVEMIDHAYFPWVTGLHILLDYYIDAEEDREMGDFNFTFQYRDMEECWSRLGFFREQAETFCQVLPNSGFHGTVIRGLLAMYLSDPKALIPVKRESSVKSIRSAGMKCQVYYRCCRALRTLRVI